MSSGSGSGRLVVLDREGRDGKRFEVPSGLATLGRDLCCDVRVLLPHVSRHHATVIVHAVQAVVRNECEGETLVNGRSVSVAALRHNDVISVGGRRMRWEYARPALRRPLTAAEPALYPCASASVHVRRARGRGRAARGSAGAAAGAGAGAAMQLALHLQHRASMPGGGGGGAGGKQVAIVQPQRRDTGQQTAAGSPRAVVPSPRAPPARPRDTTAAGALRREAPRQRQTMSPRSLALMNTTKATLWIESRKTSPRKGGKEHTPPRAPPPPRAPRSASARRATPPPPPPRPRKAQSAQRVRVTKIEDPLRIDHTKQAAIMLMTGHTHKLKGASPKQASAKNSPIFLLKRPSPVRKTRRGGGRRSGRSPKESMLGVTPKRASTYENTSLRSSNRSTAGQSVSVLEITDSDPRDSLFGASTSKSSTLEPPLPPSPKKSALKDPRAKKSMRKTESIKFDLSNLDNYSHNQSHDVLLVTDTTRGHSYEDSASEDDVTLHYDSSSTKSPSPRKSIHSRSSSRSLDKLGTLSESRVSQQSFVSADSQRARKSLRGTRELSAPANDSQSIDTTAYSRGSSKTLTDQSRNATAFKTRTLSPRTSNKNLESYSIVDLVSIDSNDTGKSGSLYGSVGSTRSSSIVFGTPQSSRRKMRSTIEPNLLGSSTPYVGGGRRSRSHSSPNVSTRTSSSHKSDKSSKVSRRSKSLTTPENTQKHISVNSTRISRASRSRSRITDSDLEYTSRLDDEAEESPKSSRRGSRADKSHNVSNISSSSSQSQRSSSRNSSPNKTFAESPQNHRTISPKHKSPVQTGSPSLLNSSRSSQGSRGSRPSPKRLSANVKRKTIGVIRSGRKGRSSPKSKSLNVSITKLSKSAVNQIFANTSASSRRSDRRSSGKNLSDTTFAESPQNKLRSSGKSFSPNKRHNSPQNKSKSPRKKLTLNITAANSTQYEGEITPENVNSPEEVGTPILSIQSLLNSSQSSLASQRSQKTKGSANKRKSVSLILTGKGRSSIGSKFINLSKRKSRSLRLSKDPSLESDGTDENALLPDNEDTVTPKSAVKLVHEAVKNKHSTAKKPQSKRSLIDNLNDSDIVKHLFNSPVKRKLSQSMTEFSRKRLFDDDDVPPRRPTRNTVALTGRTPDNSLLFDHTEDITPEKFVSPLSTPSNSPNLTGIKRLYRKNTPENDLRNVKGVKGLLKTPRPRRSVRNDLTNVSGVKVIFGKSPKNRLSNDRIRVSGVKSLFHSQVVAKNDLSDVRGVKSLFKRKSAANDLRNVSGVKKALQASSPKNDLTDVRGVRRLFRQEKQRNDWNVSGIEELYESNNSYRDTDKLFDQLVGKPPIKAVYSKSLISKSVKKQSRPRQAKSLQIPIETVTVSSEEWIEEELKKRLHNKVEASTSKARKSLNKSSVFKANITRALQKLATDTVDGDAPILASRVRSSTISKSQADITDMKKSVSESYSARKLPIKKRSLVDRSGSVLERSANKTKYNLLPLKKRAVVHSTPVKGRFYDSTMNASELGRVSPIAVVEKTHNLENNTTLRSTQKNSPKSKAKSALVEDQGIEIVQTETSQRPKGRRAANIKTIAENQELEKATQQSPKSKGRRGTRIKNVEAQIQTNSPKTKSTRATKGRSIVSKEASIESVAKTRTRNISEKDAIEAKASPKQRGRPKKSKGVIQNLEQSKAQGIPSRKTTRAAKASALNRIDEMSTRSRRNVDNTKVGNTIKRRQSLVIGKKLPVMSPKTETTPSRGVKNTSNSVGSSKSTPQKVKSPKSRPKVAVVVINRLSSRYKSKTSKVASPKVKSPVAARSTRAKANTKSPKKSPGVVNKRTRKAVEKPELTEPQTKRPRYARGAQISQEDQKKTRGKVDSKENAQSEPTGRNRKAKADVSVVPETRRGRKRKLSDDITVNPSKVTKNESTKPARGRSNNQIVSPKAAKRTVAKAIRTIPPKATASEVSKGRRQPSNQTVASPKATKATRGRPNNQAVSPKATTSVISKRARGKKEQPATPKTTKTQATRGKKTATIVAQVETVKGRGKVQTTKVPETNARNAQEDKAPSARGRKAAVAVESPGKIGHKRKISPAKAAPAKRSRRGAAPAASPGPAPPGGRSTRAKHNVSVAAQKTARSRRR